MPRTRGNIHDGPLRLVERCDGRSGHTAVLHRYPFRPKAFKLFLVMTRRLGKHDAPARTDDPMPGQMEFLRRHSERQSRLARAARQSRGAGNRSISGDLTSRNRAHHVPDRLERGIFLGSR